MTHSAVLLSSIREPSSRCGRIAKLLDFFGIPFSALSVADWLAGPRRSADAPKIRLVCSSELFVELLEHCQRSTETMAMWRTCVHSAFIDAGDDSAAMETLIRNVTGDPAAAVLHGDQGDRWSVSDVLPDFCGPMSGISLSGVKGDCRGRFALDGSRVAVDAIISTNRSAAFFKIDCHGVPVFVSGASGIVDVDSPIAARNFDIREHFLFAVPIVLYVKWAFAATCWRSPQINACLVIDDPPLKPHYGFLRFGELLDVMRHHNFSTNVAFIPWNWRRSTATTTRLFENNPDKYSLSVHGCDHTGGEFGTHDANLLAWKVKQAHDRMSWHESRTGIHHDRIMVFPQGVFSDAAMDVLKRGDFVAVVNTEMISTDANRPMIRTADVWDVAVMNYHNFALFTRRYPTQGVENFAFDMLLGKPCIVVIHHDFCRDRYGHLTEFMTRLNALNCRISWGSLGDVVRGACRQRELSAAVAEIEMYASELIVTNRFEQRKHFVIGKRECEPSAVADVLVDSRPTPWTPESDRLRFELDLRPGQTANVCVRFRQRPATGARSPEGLNYKVKTMLRRVGSEVRDNYLTRISSRFAG